MKKKKQKRFVTLIEIMIVILLIGIIGGALAFNMRGSLDHGRQFKTDQNISRVKDILEMELAKGDLSSDQILNKWTKIVSDSPLADKKNTTLDGWKKQLKVTFVEDHFEVERDKK